jgi:hypothetical protein
MTLLPIKPKIILRMGAPIDPESIVQLGLEKLEEVIKKQSRGRI